MSKTKRKQKPASQQRLPSAESSSLRFRLLTAAVAALLVGRLLVPTESAAQGATLWLAQLWLAAGLLWSWNCVRERDFRIRLDVCDLALWVVVGGHVVSALRIIMTEGQKRAAINMLWEWIGLGVAFFLIRQTVRTRAGAQRVLLVMVATAVSLSGLGLWQHYVFYPQAARHYQEQRNELDRLTLSSPGNNILQESQRLNRIRELRREFARQEIPLAGPGRSLWEQRLRSSTEPFGLFALANSFAGLLVVWLIVALAMIKGQRGRGAEGQRNKGAEGQRGKGAEGQRGRGAGQKNGVTHFCAFVPLPLCAFLLAFCLLLTKSRTAWVGLCAGLSTWAWLSVTEGKRKKEKGRHDEEEEESKKRTSRVSFVTVSLLLLTVSLFLARFSGGVDLEVLSEAPKSFRYRLQYWTATVDVIRESPWFGVGPGNFRQHYLTHKLPESSEEIADPHNLVLDLWANGGLAAVIGLAAMLAMAVRLFCRSRAVSGSGELDDDGAARMAKAQRKGSKTSTVSFFLFPFSLRAEPVLLGAGLSFWLVFGFGMFLGDGTDYRLLALFAGWVVLVMCLGRAFRAKDVSADCLAAAAVALLVHLLGAGGMEMPAIAQTLLLLLALASVLVQPAATQGERKKEKGKSEEKKGDKRTTFAVSLLSFALMAVLFVECLLTATGPVLNRRALVAAGDFAWMEQGDQHRAVTLYQRAAEHDPFSPEPAARLAELAFRRWQTSTTASEADFQHVVDLSQIAIEKNPASANGYWTLGQRYLEKFHRRANPDDAAAAVEYLTQAAERYPHHAALRAELADALDKAGLKQQARREANRSRELDQINRREGHRDKYLPPRVVDLLNRIVRDAANPAPRPNRN